MTDEPTKESDALWRDVIAMRSASIARRIAHRRNRASSCCGAGLHIGGIGATHYYVCASCGQPCDTKESPCT